MNISFRTLARAAAPLAVTLLAVPTTAQVEWRRIPVLTTAGVRGYAACDTGRGRVLLVGGRSLTGTLDTWEWDGRSWTLRSPTIAPASRSGEFGLAFDAVRQRAVLFGGHNRNDTWEWDGTDWTLRSPSPGPSPRSTPMAFDSTRGRVVLFAGDSPAGTLSDTWEWDGYQWTDVSPAYSPPARGGHTLVFDAGRGVTVLFGGAVPGSFLADTWEWDGRAWTQRTPANSPRARVHHAAFFDASRGVAAVVGGYATTLPQPLDHWEWDGTDWTLRGTRQIPLQRIGATVAFDSVRSRAVLFGGFQGTSTMQPQLSDTWEWDGSTWSQVGWSNVPLQITAFAFDVTQSAGVAFDLLFGASWTWRGMQWQGRNMVSRPSDRHDFAISTVPPRGRVVLFGGRTWSPSTDQNDTWEWDGATWTQSFPTTSPSPRSGHAMTWFSRSQSVVMVGRGETWEWDGNDWRQRSTPIAPTSRTRHVMVEDEARGVVVLFGGDPGPASDTWEWDGSAWTFRPVPGPQLDSWRMAMVYDRPRQRVVLRGENVTTQSSEIWEWEGATWTQRATVGEPESGPMAFDPVRNRVLLATSRMGMIEYGPTQDASVTAFGTGCSGSLGIPSLFARPLPWLGDTLTFEATILAAGPAVVLLGASQAVWNGTPLPFDLGPLGMPGCQLLVDPEVVLPLAVAAGTGTFRLPVVPDPGLLGLSLYAQALAIDPLANLFGATVSNGLALTLGGR